MTVTCPNLEGPPTITQEPWYFGPTHLLLEAFQANTHEPTGLRLKGDTVLEDDVAGFRQEFHWDFHPAPKFP
jgi:hypothetical protein